MRMRRRFVAAGAAAMTFALSGCGWTSRDQFLANRSVTISAQPGNGSERYSQAKDYPSRPISASVVADRHAR